MNLKDFETLVSKYNISEEDEKLLRKDLYGKDYKLVTKKDILSEYDVTELLDDSNLPRQLRGDYKYSDLKAYYRDMEILNNPDKYDSKVKVRIDKGLRANMPINEYVARDKEFGIKRYGCAQLGDPYMTFVKSLRTSIFKLADSCFGNYESASDSVFESPNSRIDKKIESDYISMVNDIVDIFKKYKAKREKETNDEQK